MATKAREVGYWATTGIIVFAMFSGGIAELAHRPETINGMKELGYPVYFIMIIGFWKILGSLVLVAPRFATAKEWAYAGIFFNMTGAAVSHVVSHSAAWHVVVTLGVATKLDHLPARHGRELPACGLGVRRTDGRRGASSGFRARRLTHHSMIDRMTTIDSSHSSYQ
jgi:hypothetical protein